MLKMKALIADDEAPLRTYLKSQLLEAWPDLIICGEAGDGRSALEMIKRFQPDVVFLDIRMPGLSGMEVAQKIAGMCWIVFITAYDQYAVEAFENDAIDYLLKPVTKERLDQTVRRLKKRIASISKPSMAISEVLEKLINGLTEKTTRHYIYWIRVQKGETIRLIPVDDVYYFKASDKYTMVITKEGESLIRKPIKELVEELNPEKFWRIHRGTIINASYIDKVSRSLTGRFVIKIKDISETLTVSRTYTHLFKQM